MKIALTHCFCWPEVRRGAERYAQQLGAALVTRGHEVTILSSGWEAVDDELDGVRTVRLRRRHDDVGRHEADFGRRVLPRLLQDDWDVVHSLGRHDGAASVRAARFRRGRRTVYTDLGLPSRAWWRSQPRRDQRAVRTVVRGVDVYGCMSRYALAFLAEDYDRTDGVVMPGGVELDQFVPAERRTPAPTVLFSGAIDEPRKGVATLLAAMALVLEVRPDASLWLSGPGDAGPLLADVPAEVRERVEVLGVGDRDRQHERYGQAWVTTLPSTHDSFGMALVESLACGTPLVVTTHGAPKELVDEGRTGELCEPGDARGLADALLRGFDLAGRPETVEACRTSAAAFDWRASVAPAAEALYLGESPRPFWAGNSPRS